MTLRSSPAFPFLVSMAVMMTTSATIPNFLASGLHAYRDSNLLRKLPDFGYACRRVRSIMEYFACTLPQWPDSPYQPK
jgi:hypothetical protein